MLVSVPPLMRTALLCLCLLPSLATASPLASILGEELERNFRVLKEKADPAPYYLGYSVTDEEVWVVSATQGALKSNTGDRNRSLDVTVRVGSRKLDNYHRLAGERPTFAARRVPLPLDDVPAAIKRLAWVQTDRVYRAAAERLIKIKTSRDVKVAEEDNSDDFSVEEPSVAAQPPKRFEFDREQWAARIRKLSAEFSRYPSILTSQVTLIAQREEKTMVTTEGTRLDHGRGFARILISARAKAADGMDLVTSESFEAESAAELPKDEVIRAGIERVAKDLTGMLRAPVVEPFAGPAILSGRAAAVLFHEIFGHRIEGHRQKDETEGQTFTKSLGTKVLPDFLSVVFDPTRHKTGAQELNGWYTYDDEGTKARPVTVVDRGVLKTFLISRSPVKGFDHSNGHGRRQPGMEVVSRQSNLFVESAQQVPYQQLREMLIGEIRKQNKPYGLYFEQVTGGYTSTGRRGVQAFKVIPLVVYRVYPDGRPDELVRGADIVGTPLASFSRIVATSDKPEVFNGYCGAESGNVPVSAVSPAILLSEIEIEKKEKSQDRPPLLPRPAGEER
jgi:TldD protein